MIAPAAAATATVTKLRLSRSDNMQAGRRRTRGCAARPVTREGGDFNDLERRRNLSRRLIRVARRNREKLADGHGFCPEICLKEAVWFSL